MPIKTILVKRKKNLKFENWEMLDNSVLVLFCSSKFGVHFGITKSFLKSLDHMCEEKDRNFNIQGGSGEGITPWLSSWRSLRVLKWFLRTYLFYSPGNGKEQSQQWDHLKEQLVKGNNACNVLIMKLDNLESSSADTESKTSFLLFRRRKSNSRKGNTGKHQPQLLIKDQCKQFVSCYF